MGKINSTSFVLSFVVVFRDLHLAAELGKTLLDRNRELEAILKEKQTTIEDQKLEIEYLTKQTVALKEVNESRLRIYEQLEVNIQDLERTNHRLQFENNTEKKHVKSLNETVEKLEAKNEELDSTVRDLRRRLQNVSERKSPQSSDGGRSSNTISHKEFRSVSPISSKYDKVASPCQEGTNFLQLDHVRRISSTPNPCKSKPVATSNQPECDQASIEEPDRNMEEMTELMAQLRESRVQCSRYERKLTELEENLASIVQQNSVLESQVITLTHKEEDLNMKSMHEELTTLAEVRQGQLCSKCLGSMEMEQPSEVELPEDDDLSMLNSLNTSQHRSSFTMSVQDHAANQSSPIPKESNPYIAMVEKYRPLVEGHRCKPLSLQEDLKETRTTDFSEAETSSSGFADETSNKGTQTDGRVGSFLCTIADGEDCKFSIYDDASPFDSRFRDKPEYRELFKEIFRVLKKAAENKQEGEVVLEDKLPAVPPVTPMTEQLPEFDDDTQSVLSSTMSEISAQNDTTTIADLIQVPIPESKQEFVLRPLVREPLEYLSVEVRKRSSSRRKNKFTERSDSPITHIIGSPKITYASKGGSGRRRSRDNRQPEENWNGNTLQFWATNRNAPSPTPSQSSTSSKSYLEFKPSPATHELNKLKKLDMSYAEVLRKADSKKKELLRQRRH